MSQMMRLMAAGLALLLGILAVGGCSQSSSSLDSDRYESETSGGTSNEQNQGNEGEVSSLQALAVAPVRGAEYISVDAGRDQVADPNVVMFLNGEAASSMDDIVAVYWNQLKGPEVTIANPASLTPAFITPDIDGSDMLKFRLTVQDASGNINYDTLTVRIEPLSRLVTVVGVVVEESEDYALFQIRLSPAQPTDFIVDFNTVNGTSIDSIDYEETFGTVTFAPGETLKEVRVPILSDETGEGIETFGLDVSYSVDGEPYVAQGTALIFDGTDLGENPSQDGLEGGSGIVRINLEWPSDAIDLDIHVYDPCGNHIYYGNRTAVCNELTGQLDVDNVDADVTEAVENIFWDESAPLGNYRVVLDHFNGTASPYVVRIFYGNNSQEFSGSIGPDDEITILEFDYQGN
ncbi:Calx-beta domain-containing protein [Hahella ganghwensis]|uniref:Calx-beta domain-containing protein n=1 Tax=Hahella ganghwensis TaxID=286420 RepID=UPI0003781AB5|nr:Calx-beta domain-containing protein [Hahella ganghwensis]